MTNWQVLLFSFSSRRRHTRFDCDWSSDVCSSDLTGKEKFIQAIRHRRGGGKGEHRVAADEDAHRHARAGLVVRSEERRVGKECRSRGLLERQKNRNYKVNKSVDRDASISETLGGD